MFGYLNLNNPTLIGPTEAQEAMNCRVDHGYLEFQEWAIDETINRIGKDLAGRELYINTASSPYPAFPSPGFLYRRMSTVVDDCIGSPAPSYLTLAPDPWNIGSGAGNHPRIYNNAAGAQYYPQGVYDYALTLYNPDTGEEGLAYSPITRTIGANEALDLSAFPASGVNFPAKTNLKWRLYRKPLGGSEYLRVMTLYNTATAANVTDFPAFTALAGPFQDRVDDEDLGEACEAFDNWIPDVFPFARLFSIWTVHNEKLFFVQDIKTVAGPGSSEFSDKSSGGYAIYFSKTGEFGAVPADNVFFFNSKPVGMFTLNEALVIVTEEKIWILYGQDETDFQLKPVQDSKIGGIGGYSAAVLLDTLIFLGKNPDPLSPQADGNGIFAFIGNGIQRISYKVDTLFPIQPFNLGAGNPLFFGAGVHEDRFWIVRHSLAGVNRYLVFDWPAKGFLTGSVEPTTFSYRTKEVEDKLPINTRNKRFEVEGEGEFDVEYWGDNVLLSTEPFNVAGRQTAWFDVSPVQVRTFSLRFVGKPGAKIYGYQRVD